MTIKKTVTKKLHDWQGTEWNDDVSSLTQHANEFIMNAITADS